MARQLTNEQIISNVYYDINEGFGSIQETYKKSKQKRPEITLQEVKDFLRKQPNRQIKGYRGTNSYTAPFARYQYQIDVMFMSPLSDNPEVEISTKGQPKQALVVIDIFSKMADVIPMKEYNSENVLSALKQAFKEMGYPMVIYSDNDGAFQSVVKKFFDDEAIQHIVTQTHANVAERFIRTVKNMIHDRVRFNKAGWTSMLPAVLKKYNSTEHSSTKMTPNQAHKDDNNLKVRVNLTLREKNRRKYPEIKEGDSVKYFKKKKGNYTDRKEYNSKWSPNSYKVLKIQRDMTGGRTFKLEGLPKPFLRHEILLVS